MPIRTRRRYDPIVDTNVDLRDRVQQVSLEWPSYGYRRITHELLRRGVDVGLKTVLRLMREDNLLCLRKQRFRIATTDSDHGLPTYKNLDSSCTTQTGAASTPVPSISRHLLTTASPSA